MRLLSRRFVVAYHARLIDVFGGTPGIRDEGLLDSALAQPQATFDGAPLHRDVWEMAAATGFHLCRNHPFLDGNERIAAVAMGTFLAVNGEASVFDEVELYLTVTAVADGRMDKSELAAWLRAAARASDAVGGEGRPAPEDGPSAAGGRRRRGADGSRGARAGRPERPGP